MGAAKEGEQPKSRSEEFKLIKQLVEEPLVSGDEYCVVSAEWYRQWKSYTEKPSDGTSRGVHPGAIENGDLTLEKSTKSHQEVVNDMVLLAEGVQEQEDFVIMPAKAYQLLQSWYGGGPEIKRLAITEGVEKKTRVELYLKNLQLKRVGEEKKPKSFLLYLSKHSTVGELAMAAEAVLGRGEEWKGKGAAVRLWNAFTEESLELLSDSERTVEDMQLVDGQLILIEFREKTGDWPKGDQTQKATKKGGDSRGSSGGQGKVGRMFSFISKAFLNTTNTVTAVATNAVVPSLSGGGSSKGKGVCGLANLGNTCFMNAALQCLSNTAPLTEYFLKNKYKDDVNRDNPLGMNGTLAEQYAVLIKSLWSGNHGYVAPKNLKWTIGKFAPRFNGYSQQDSQELLAFLLDGLHEDLNRVIDKKYVELDESDGRPDEAVAKEAWEKHLQRNRSIIVELFQAQLKSTLVCPDCSKVSITFDPFMYLSVPLPRNKGLIEVTLWDNDNKAMPKKYAVRLPSTSTVSLLLENIAHQAGRNADDLLLVSTQSYRVHSFPVNDAQVRSLSASVSSTFLYAHCIPGLSQLREKEYVRTSFIHRRDVRHRAGLPFVVMLPPDIKGRHLYLLVWKRLQRFLVKDLQDPMFKRSDHALEDVTEGEADAGKGDEGEENQRDDKQGKESKRKGSHKSDKSQTERLKLTDGEAMAKTQALETPTVAECDNEEGDNAEGDNEEGDKTEQKKVKKEKEEKEEKKEKEKKEKEKERKERKRERKEKSVKKDKKEKDKETEEATETKYNETAEETAMAKKTGKDSVEGMDQKTNGASKKVDGRIKENAWQESSAWSGLTPEDLEEGEEGPWERIAELCERTDFNAELLPFSLCYVYPSGQSCSKCKFSMRRCTGCKVESDDTPVSVDSKSYTIAIDWKGDEYPRYTNSEVAVAVRLDSNVKSVRAEKESAISLHDCIDLFSQEETLGQNDMWYCPSCKDHVRATKQIHLWTCPEILVIHLKRFQAYKNYREKLSAAVQFPSKDLDLSSTVLSNAEGESLHYDLFGIVNHSGSLRGGHYTALAFNHETKEWYNFNDSSVGPAQCPSQSGSAYLLFYQKRKGGDAHTSRKERDSG